MSDLRTVGTDPDEFERFYREHLGSVERFIARRVSDPAEAADLTADVFLAVIENAAGYRPERGSPTAWLFGIARNTVHSQYRRMGREAHATRRFAHRRILEPDAMARAVERIDAAATARAYRERIAVLPARLRDVLELVAVDELSVTEAAAVLKISPSAARVRLHRARKKLTSPVSGPNLSAVTEGDHS